MIDEPYRWVEAIANRREYIESELAPGSPTIALSCQEGVLLLTFGKDRKKIFEIYDQIANDKVFDLLQQNAKLEEVPAGTLSQGKPQ